MSVIEFDSVSQRVADGTVVFGESSFEISEGEVFGVVSSDRRLRSELVRLVGGVSKPTTGIVRLDGHPLTVVNSSDIRFCGNGPVGYEEMTPRMYLEHFAGLYDVSPSVANEQIVRTLEWFDIGLCCNLSLSEFDAETRRQLAVARLLIDDPRVLVCEAVDSGMDGDAVSRIIEFSQAVVDSPFAFVASFATLDVAQEVCDRVAFVGTDGVSFNAPECDLTKAVSADSL